MENNNQKDLKEEKKWFKAKRYGWGWRPCSWQGWIIMIAYTLVLLSSAVQLDAKSHSVSDTLINFAIVFIPVTLLLIVICYVKGDRPYWRWGEDKGTDLNKEDNVDKEQK